MEPSPTILLRTLDQAWDTEAWAGSLLPADDGEKEEAWSGSKTARTLERSEALHCFGPLFCLCSGAEEEEEEATAASPQCGEGEGDCESDGGAAPL
jgi:hypothetical protein